MAAEATAPTPREFRRLYDKFPQLRAAVSECQDLDRRQWAADATARHDAIDHDDCTLLVVMTIDDVDHSVFVNRLGTEVKYNHLKLNIVTDKRGYRTITIQKARPTVASLVCTAVHGPAPEGCVAKRIDQDAGDAGAKLRWATQAEVQIGTRHKRSSEPAMVD